MPITLNPGSCVVDGFKGINNVVDPTRLGLEWCIRTENILCDNAQHLVSRPGWEEVMDGIIDLYNTRSGRLLAINDANQLVEIQPSGSPSILFDGVEGAPFRWTELGYAVFVQSDTHQWAIYPDRMIPWGSLVSAPTIDLGDTISGGDGILSLSSAQQRITYSPPPIGKVLGVYGNRIAIADHELSKDRSIIYFSRPDYPHHFDLGQDFQIIPGRITLLAAVQRAMVIATDRAIYITSAAGTQRVADYGAEPNYCYDKDGSVLFWSHRGQCRVGALDLAFTNLTESVLSPVSRLNASNAILSHQGSRYAIAYQSNAELPLYPAQDYVGLSTE